MNGSLYVYAMPNEPADFENPFHLHLFDAQELREMLSEHFDVPKSHIRILKGLNGRNKVIEIGL